MKLQCLQNLTPRVNTSLSKHTKNLSTVSAEVSKQRYKDSNLEMTESESVALPFGDSAIFYLSVLTLCSTLFSIYQVSKKCKYFFQIFFKIF